MSAPSLKTLKKFFPPHQARKLRDLMTGKTDPNTYDAVKQWTDQCFNPPSENELIMEALNEELETCGVETIRGRYVDNYHDDIQAVYCNTGDTYDITILLDHETGNFRVTSWGDWFEAHQRPRELA